MSFGRRRFMHALGLGALAGAGAATACSNQSAGGGSTATSGAPAGAPGGEASGAAGDGVPAAIRALKPMTQGIVPIGDDERRARIEKARRLMAEHKIDALFIEPGSSMTYFTGTRWGTSERLFAMVLPAKGDIAWVCPKFEEQRAREVTKFSTDIRTWEEDASPYQVVAGILKDRGAAQGRIGIEERVRFFLYDGIRQETPGATFVDGTPSDGGLPHVQSPTEIALMQRATTSRSRHQGRFAAQRVRRNVEAAFEALGAPADRRARSSAISAFPHGSIQPSA